LKTPGGFASGCWCNRLRSQPLPLLLLLVQLHQALLQGLLQAQRLLLVSS
jgi:hypothetical protein